MRRFLLIETTNFILFFNGPLRTNLLRKILMVNLKSAFLVLTAKWLPSILSTTLYHTRYVFAKFGIK